MQPMYLVSLAVKFNCKALRKKAPENTAYIQAHLSAWN